MRANLWVKLTIAFAATAVVAIAVAAVLVERATAAGFGRYLEHGWSMGGMMGQDMWAMMGVPERAFLSEVRTSLWIAGGSALALAVLMGIILSRQITAPLRKLGLAAARVARGDLSCRVQPASADEVGTLAQTFNSMVDSLAHNQEARRKLMADLAHEMSTPLSVMQANLEAMVDGVAEPTKASVSSLHEETLLLSRLVRDLRTLSQAESGRLDLLPSPGDLGATVSSVVKAAEAEARRKSVALSLEVERDLPKAMMDQDRVSQVVGNLLSNALRYTSEGGAVSVRVSRSRRNGASQGLLVSVGDTGQGIAKEDLPRVFERYFQGSLARERRAGGSGIGLAVVKELVEAQRGKVWVESEPGSGSTFFFTLPAA